MFESMRNLIKRYFPTFVECYRNTRRMSMEFVPLQHIFSRIYRNNEWSDRESKSGPGSNFVNTRKTAKELASLLTELEVKKLIDAPCGDFNWIKDIVLNKPQEYVGVDIVDELVAQNNDRYQKGNIHFLSLDITKDPIPKGDLILCRDCLVHLSYKNIFSALNNFKNSGAKYLVVTTFTTVKFNMDMMNGGWRPLNFFLPPFNFPPPLKLINEEWINENGEDSGKHLGVWNLSELFR